VDQESPRYRVVYRDGERVRPLGHLTGVAPTPWSLDAYISRLLLAGVTRGELLLVAEGTGALVARRAVRQRRQS
jgi:hypothetical protein